MKSKIVLSIVILWLIIPGMLAQVTIGSAVEPMGGSLLDLKQDDNNSKNSNLGLKIPRVNLSDIYELYPMYGSKSNENQLYTSNKVSLKNNNKGLMVYNMSEESGMVRGMYIWDGDMWMNFKTRDLSVPAISQVLCDAAYMEPAFYTAGLPFNGILKIPYLGGNGAFHSETDVITANGLTFTLQSGQLVHGAGFLAYRVSGTPTVSSPTTTTIPISFLGHSCNDVTVGYSPEKELNYHRSIVPLNAETTANSEIYVGDVIFRYNYAANGEGYVEYKLDMPAHITYHFDKSRGYGTYGQFDAAAGVWLNFINGDNTSHKRTDMWIDGILNFNQREMATAHVVIQRDDNRDVYRLTAIAHGDITSNTPNVSATLILFVERLETQINIQ